MNVLGSDTLLETRSMLMTILWCGQAWPNVVYYYAILHVSDEDQNMRKAWNRSE